MEKITLNNVSSISHRMAKKKGSFSANPFSLLENCYFEEMEGDLRVYYPSVKRPGNYNLITVPSSKIGLGEKPGFTMLFSEEIKELELLGLTVVNSGVLGPEFFYRTSDYVNLAGSEFARCRKRIHKLQTGHNIKILPTYDQSKIISFINTWSETKDVSIMAEKELGVFTGEKEESIKAIDLLDKIPNKSYFAEIDGQLAGFRITVPLNDSLWAGVFQKIDYHFEGLNEYLYYVSAQDYKEIEYFTTGSCGQSKGLEQHKRNLHPCAEKMHYYAFCENNLN